MAEQGTPRFGILIIGDELLSGRRQDKHMAAVIERLEARGLELSWARIVGDDPALLTENLQQTFASGDVVFSFGGIGATPDDRTRQCAAAALGLPLVLHPEGEREIREQFGERATAQRLRMAEFPEGAELIPNPVNRVAGFSIRHHHFVPGFPKMAWPMVAWVLDHHYARWHAPGVRVQQTLRVPGAREGDLIPLMEAFVARYPDLRLSCLPKSDAQGFEVELGLRGEGHRVAPAMHELRTGVEALGYEVRE
ncbi:competence/damage-inducible protein A [Alkalilimnicola ehrlichii MLHE-1]|uniref:Molybdopterin binding domain protein n=1 Tax=Alkalilimnicola ehrlichii (strain ATCC BAA-1101 / DSM 17681 / MLHE-1) TaxID=187272 RepID=Q0A9C7_ALKEH|nr:competence/damage-inducible protein A [Alkalilimnicola ehrlichii]ABI56560.1 molybdopterin binding domain protein [Alkalilimnicola ehrlichii MLHE-1]